MLYVAAPHKLKITQFGTTKVPGNFPNVQTCAIDCHFYYYRIMASRMQPIQPTLRADIPSSTTVKAAEDTENKKRKGVACSVLSLDDIGTMSDNSDCKY